MAKARDCEFLETSAKTGHNVVALFHGLGELCKIHDLAWALGSNPPTGFTLWMRLSTFPQWVSAKFESVFVANIISNAIPEREYDSTCHSIVK